MGTNGYGGPALVLAIVVSVVWGLVLTVPNESWTPGGTAGTALWGFLLPVLVLPVPAGLVIGAVGGEGLFLESGLATLIGYLVAVAGGLLFGAIVRGDPALTGFSPGLLLGFTYSLLVGLVLFPVFVLVGGYTARTVRRVLSPRT